MAGKCGGRGKYKKGHKMAGKCKCKHGATKAQNKCKKGRKHS